MTNGSLMKVESIAECSHWSILQYVWPALSNNWSLKPICGIFESDRFTQVSLYCKTSSHFNDNNHHWSNRMLNWYWPLMRVLSFLQGEAYLNTNGKQICCINFMFSVTYIVNFHCIGTFNHLWKTKPNLPISYWINKSYSDFWTPLGTCN